MIMKVQAFNSSSNNNNNNYSYYYPFYYYYDFIDRVNGRKYDRNICLLPFIVKRTFKVQTM